MNATDTDPRNPFASAQQQRRGDAASGIWQRISVDTTSGCTTITIVRPDVFNCFDYLTLLELADALHDAGRDPRVFCVVLTGTGTRAFCTGADLREQRDVLAPNPQHYYTWMGAFIDVHERLRNIGKPTIARINGIAVGGGNEFGMACDLAVMVDDAYIKHVGPYHGSVPAGGATQWLQLLVGDRRAREIIWLGEEVPAATALEWGLVNRVVPRERLDAEVDTLVQRLAQTLPETIRYTRTQTNYWKDMSWYATIHHARDWLAVHTAAPEVHEAVAAFTDKRPMQHALVHERFGTPEGAYSTPPSARSCPTCSARDLPLNHTHCGHCGAQLPAGSPLETGAPHGI